MRKPRPCAWMEAKLVVKLARKGEIFYTHINNIFQRQPQLAEDDRAWLAVDWARI